MKNMITNSMLVSGEKSPFHSLPFDVSVTLMTQIGFHESGENTPSPEVSVKIVVPEEFLGMACDEVITRRGLITGMDKQSELFTICASLPLSELDGLNRMITSDVPHGRVERDAQPPTG